MVKKYWRTPKNYDGSGVTTHRISELLPYVLRQVGKLHEQRPDLVVAAWPEIIGPKLAPMTQALTFTSGVLAVKVKNSTLLSLLSQHDKPRILASLKQKFPNVEIRNVVFRIG
jgi:hypothetical protein